MVCHLGRHRQDRGYWAVVGSWSFVGHFNVLVILGSCPISCSVATWGWGGGRRGCGVFCEGRYRSGERKAGLGGGVRNYWLGVYREHCCRWDRDRCDIALDHGGGSYPAVGAVCHAFGQRFWGRSQQCFGTVASFVLIMAFFFLFFLASAVAAAGPLEMATRAAVEVFWGASLEVVSADMGRNCR